MNEATTKTCEKIFRSLLDIPISSVLWEFRPELSGDSERLPFYLENVALKLNRNLYNSPNQFIEEIQQIIQKAKIERKRKTIYHISATIIEEELKRLLEENSFESSQLAQKEKEIEELFNSCTKKEIKITQNKSKNEETEPGSSFLNRDPNTFTADDLSQLISAMQSPDVVIAVASELKKLQPECISLNEDDLVFHFCLMTEETVHELSRVAIKEGKKFVKMLNK